MITFFIQAGDEASKSIPYKIGYQVGYFVGENFYTMAAVAALLSAAFIYFMFFRNKRKSLD